MKLKHHLAALALASLAPMAQAAINSGDSPELMLVLWDSTTGSSYTRDLGLNGYSGTDLTLRSQSFWVYGQQDTGFQQFWTLDEALDANYAQFRRTATNTANMVWAVIGVDAEGGDAGTAAAGAFNIFTTLRATDTAGVTGGAYGNATNPSTWMGIELETQLNASGRYLNWLNTALATGAEVRNPWNTHLGEAAAGEATGATNYAVHGSSFDLEGQPGYFGQPGNSTWGSACACDITTPVGQSSWFYRMSNADDFDIFAPVAIDEFDNTGYDAYWGVALNPADGKLVLSYTLPASVTPVPEPTGWALSLAGLAALGAWARRKRQA
jgi:MYXO-CTERM domain-containing protein